MRRIERQFAKRLDELEREFLTRYQDYLSRVIYLPFVYNTKQIALLQFPLPGVLSSLLAEYVQDIFAVGQAHGDILCRDKYKKYAPLKLSSHNDFWLVPEEALRALEARSVLLAGDVEHQILTGIKKILLDHLNGTTRQEAEKAIAALLKQNSDRAALIVTTETTYAYNRGRLASFNAGGVDYVRFSAVMDARTSAQCRSRHGKVMRLDSPELAGNTPPLHGRCRSILSPVYSEYQPEMITPEATDWSRAASLPKGWRTN